MFVLAASGSNDQPRAQILQRGHLALAFVAPAKSAHK